MHFGIIAFFILHYASIFAMNKVQPSYTFSQRGAQQNSDDYHVLSQYLYKHVDLPKEQEPFFWKDMEIAEGELNAYQWIESEALNNGNIVGLYFFIRNYLKYCKPYLESFTNLDHHRVHLPQCLMAVILCLQRVLYDIAQYYVFIKPDPSVFTVYTIFKKKIHHMLSKSIPNNIETLDLTDVSYFKTIYQNIVEYWSGKGWHLSVYPCTWVNAFNWANPWTVGAWGIVFKQIPSPLEPNNYTRINDEILQTVLNQFSYTVSWQSFFKTFDFPLKKEFLDGIRTAELETEFVLL